MDDGECRGQPSKKRSLFLFLGSSARPSARPPIMLPSIRFAEPRDIAAITAIYDAAVRHGTATFEIDPPDEREMRRRYEALRAGGYPYLVAEAGGIILGYAYAGPYRDRPAYRWCIEDSVYVAQQSQRRGLGRALLERLIDDACNGGFRH